MGRLKNVERTQQFNIRAPKELLSKLGGLADRDRVSRGAMAIALWEDKIKIEKLECIAIHGIFGKSGIVCPCPRHFLDLSRLTTKESIVAIDVDQIRRGMCIAFKKGLGLSGIRCQCSACGIAKRYKKASGSNPEKTRHK